MTLRFLYYTQEECVYHVVAIGQEESWNQEKLLLPPWQAALQVLSWWYKPLMGTQIPQKRSVKRKAPPAESAFGYLWKMYHHGGRSELRRVQTVNAVNEWRFAKVVQNCNPGGTVELYRFIPVFSGVKRFYLQKNFIPYNQWKDGSQWLK